MARPRSLVGGHLIGAVTGLLFAHLLGDGVIVMSSAVGTTLLLMILTRTVHSPAGATPLIAISSHAAWFFVVDPVAIGLATLLVGKICYERLWLRQRQPSWRLRGWGALRARMEERHALAEGALGSGGVHNPADASSVRIGGDRIRV
jgi:CBS-domain-containing membrane protein